MKSYRFSILLAVLVVLTGTTPTFGVVRTTTAAGGFWNLTTTWSGGVVPANTDAAIILAGASVTVSNVATINSITFSNNSAALATLSVNSGVTLTVTAGVTNQNSATTNTSALIQGAGTITCASLSVGGTTTPTPVSSDFFATMTSTISNLSISGSLTVKALYNSAQSAASQGTFALSSGSVSMTGGVVFITVPLFGPILTMDVGTESGTLTISGTTPFTITGGGSSTFTPGGTNATVVYSGTAQIVKSATYQNLTLAGSGGKTMTGVTVNGRLSRQGTATASPAPAYGAGAELEYKGSAAQTSGSELTTNLANLSINNPNGVTATNNPTITGDLSLISGLLATGANQINVGTNGSVSGGSSSSYVNGKLQKAFSPGTQTFTFPIGDGTTYAPVTLSNLSVSTAGSVRLATTAGAHPQLATSGIDAIADVARNWTLTQSGGSFGAYAATFNYPPTEVDVTATPDDFVAARWTGAGWLPATVSGTPTTNATSISDQVGFGDFAIGNPTPLEVIWSAGGGANQNWSNGSNWLGGSVPRPIDDVFFYDSGAVVTASNINNVVDGTFGGTVGSVTYGNTNNFHTTLIKDGVTLTCLSNFTVGTESYVSATHKIGATITGSGGTLNLSLPTNVIWSVREGVASGVTSTLAPGTPKATLDLSGLGMFLLTCRSMDVGVESAAIRRVAATLYLARTNILSLAGLPTLGTTFSGNPGVYIGHNTQPDNQSSSGSTLYLGITNAVFADYVVTGRGNQTNNLMAFNPAFVASSPVAYFRGLGGTNRVDVWSIGDNSPSGNISSPSSGTNDFTGGKVDALVDIMFVGRGAQNNQSGAASPGIGTLTFNNGSFDANTVYVGYQNLGTNFYSGGIGTINVIGSNATLIANSTLELGHATNTSIVSPSGTLNIVGGKVLANTIVAGGGSAAISITNGSLVITNTAGNSLSPVSSLSITNSTLQLSIVGNLTNAVVTSLTTGGTTNRINIAALPAVASYPTQFTLIKYSGVISGAGFNFGLGTLPPANPGYQGYVSNNATRTSIVLVLTQPPTRLAITSINGGTSPTFAAPFNVVIQSQDNGSIPRIVTTNTSVTLSLSNGTGVLGGTLTEIMAAGTSSITISNVTYGKAEAGVVITATRTAGENLSAGNSSAFTVTPANQVITFPSPGNQTYGVAPITLSATASSGLAVSYSVTVGPASVNSNILTITGAGSVTVQASQSGNANWNAAALTNQSITVAAKTATGSITVNNKIYDGTNAATIATRSLSGVINSDLANLAGGTAVFGDKIVGSNKMVVATGLTLSGAQAGNYVLASTSATNTASITTKTLTVSGLTATNKVYDATTNATLNTGSAALVGVAAGDTVTLNTAGATGAFASKTIGNSKIVTVAGLAITGIDATNYALTQPSPTANITARSLAVNAVGVNKPYDAATNATVTLGDNRVAGDVLTTSYTTANFLDKNVGNAKTVNVNGIAISGTDSGNYTANTSTNTTANITARSLIVTAAGIGRVYDGTSNATVTLSDNRIAGDVLTLSYTNAIFTNKNVGVGKAVNVTGISISGTDAGNYTANSTAGTTANITVRTLTISANGGGKVYDGGTNATVTLSDDRVAGDVLSTSYATAAFSSRNVGNGKTINVTGIAVSGADSGNYTANTTANTTANVTARSLAVTATGINKPYDGNTTATVTLSDNRLGGDVLTTSYSTASFVNKNAGNGKTVNVSGIAISGADSGNYSPNPTTNTTANITALLLTVAANSTNRVYGASNPGFTVAYTGFANGEDAAVLSGLPLLVTAATNNSTVAGSPYSIVASQGTLSAANYTFNFVNGALTVTRALLTVRGDNKSRPYGTPNPPLTVAYVGFANSETTNALSGQPALSTSAGTSSPVGVYAIETTVGTLSAANYNFAATNGALTILEVPPVLNINFAVTVGATNHISLQCLGVTPGSNYHIIASTDLNHWSDIGTVQGTVVGGISFTDTNNLPFRFYRIFEP